MREQAVPCVNATHWESAQGLHTTWNDNRVCTNCGRVQDLFAQRRAVAESFTEDEAPS